jgi:hypothetical protein
MPSKKKKNVQNMKSLEIDPCPNCLYGKNRNQHNVPKRVENFNRVKPKEAFGVKKSKPKPKSKPTKSNPKKPKY